MEIWRSDVTQHGGPRLRQDFQHAAPARKDVYIKITLRDVAPVIQFKEM